MLLKRNGVLCSVGYCQVVKGPGNVRILFTGGCNTNKNVATTTTAKRAVQRPARGTETET